MAPHKTVALLVCFLALPVARGQSTDYANSFAALSQKLIKQNVQADSNGLLRFAELIGNSLGSVRWEEWQDYPTRSAIIKATTGHPEWSSSLATVQYATAVAEDARSGLRPQITGGMDYGRRHSSANSFSQSNGFGYGAVTSKLNVNQIVYDGSSTNDTWLSAKDKAKAQFFQSDIIQSEVLFGLLQALLNKQRYEVHKFWVTKFAAQRTLSADKMMRRFDLGASTIYEVARSEVKGYEAATLLRQIDQQLARSKTLITQYQLPDTLTIPIITERVRDDEAYVAKLLMEHPTIQSAEALLQAASLELSSARAALKAPKVNFEASLSRRDFDGYAKPAYDASVVLSLTYSLQSGGKYSAKVEQAVARLTQVQDELEQRKRDLRSRVLDSAFETNQLISLASIRGNSLRSSIAVFAANSRLFELNRGNIAELQRVEDELSTALRIFVDTWFDLGISYFRYLHETNTLKHVFFKSPIQQTE